MGKFVENNLNKGETIVQKAQLNPIFLVGAWVKGILLFWLLFIPLIKAIAATIQFMHIELVVTNKRIVGRVGVFNTKTLDAPLNKIQNVSATQKLGGKIFNYGTINVMTAAGQFLFPAVKNPEQFRGAVSNQIDQYEEDRAKQQAEEMAKAMAGVLNNK